MSAAFRIYRQNRPDFSGSVDKCRRRAAFDGLISIQNDYYRQNRANGTAFVDIFLIYIDKTGAFLRILSIIHLSGLQMSRSERIYCQNRHLSRVFVDKSFLGGRNRGDFGPSNGGYCRAGAAHTHFGSEIREKHCQKFGAVSKSGSNCILRPAFPPKRTQFTAKMVSPLHFWQ